MQRAQSVPAASNPNPAGPTASPLSVTINNNAPVKATAEHSQNANGEQELVVRIDEIIAQSVTNGGRTHDAIQKRFGVNPGGSTPRY